MSKKDKVKCQGITNKKNICFKFAIGKTKYCNSHSYLHEFTDETIQEIINDKNDKYKFCNRCSRWHTEKVNTCANCTKISSEKARIKQANKIKEKIKNGDACSGLHKDGSICGFKISQNGYCKNHLYMIDYTDEMKKVENLQQCSACKRYVYFGEFKNNKTCLKCRSNSFEQRTKIKNEYIPCRAKECNFKQCPKLNNGYCGKHQKQKIVDDAIRDNKVLCSNHTKQACYNILPDNYEYKQCESCRINERKTDTKIRHNAIIYAINERLKGIINYEILNDEFDKFDMNNLNQEYTTDLVNYYNENKVKFDIKYDEYKIYPCSNCPKNNLFHDIYDFKILKNGRLDLKCYNCREKIHNKENNRIYNPVKLKYKWYKKSARKRNLNFELDYNQFDHFVTQNCVYCNKNKIGINGIDRINNNIGYLYENCVPCCNMCNMIKYTYDLNTLEKKIEHILTNIMLLFNGKFYPELFNDIYGYRYSKHIYYSKIRNIQNKLTKDEYDTIKSVNCYLCGKINTKTHNNGIDRVDSSGLYELSNCVACCYECNIMKRAFPLHEFIKSLCNFYKYFNKNKKIFDGTDKIEDCKKIIDTSDNFIKIICDMIIEYNQNEINKKLELLNTIN